ncbi:MAG TPA: transposase [Stenomitos sp.]
MDEAGVNLGMVRLYARALKGKRATGTRPHKRGKNVSMVSAITVKEVLTFFNVLGATDRIRRIATIREKFRHLRQIPYWVWVSASTFRDELSFL